MREAGDDNGERRETEICEEQKGKGADKEERREMESEGKRKTLM